MKRNKKIIKALKILGILAIIFLLANIGLNLWLKYKLPDYIKNNTDYKIDYKTLDIDIMSGNIQSTDIKVSSKNINNHNVIGIDGNVGKLKISRFGIIDAIFRKTISSNEIILDRPNLKIQLAKPLEEKKAKKGNPVSFENIKIENGNIEIVRHTQQKFFSVKNFNLYVENLQMTEESSEDKLPFMFDDYNIQGEQFYLQPNEAYVLNVSKIATKKGAMQISGIQLKPQLSPENFRQKFTKQNQMFDIQVMMMDFKDISLKNNKISVTNTKLTQPIIKIVQVAPSTKKEKKPTKFDANFGDIAIKDGIFSIENTLGEKTFNTESINVDIQKLVFNEKSSVLPIPFTYDHFSFSTKNLYSVNENQKIEADGLNISQKTGSVKNFRASTIGSSSTKTTMDVAINWLQFDFNEFKFIDEKLNLDIKKVFVNGINGTVHARNNPNKNKKPDYSKIKFPIIVRNIEVRNSNLAIEKPDNSWKFNRLNIIMNNFEANIKSKGDGLSYKIGNYNTTANAQNSSKFYNLTLGLLKVNKSKIQINNFAMKPKVSRSQFVSMIPTERDLYDLQANQVTVDGNWDLFSENKSFFANQVTLNSVNALIFRSKAPKDDLREKPLYSKLLRSINFPMFVNQLDIKNSALSYEEDTPESSGPGKLSFGNFNMNVRNLNSGKMKGKPTKVIIKVNCSFMNASPMNVDWSFDVANQSDQFNIAGTVSDLSAPRINPFVKPYLNVAVSGEIQQMAFNFNGNKNGLNGKFNLKHKDLKVSLLNKETKEKKGVLSSIANLFIKTNSGDYPASVDVTNVQRDPTKSFFNLFWKGIQSGLKTTLIGDIDVKVKNTTTNVKEGVKSVTEDVKSKVQEVTQPKEEKKTKGGLLKRVFNKKDKKETEKK